MIERDPRVNPQEGDWLSNGGVDFRIEGIEHGIVRVSRSYTRTGDRLCDMCVPLSAYPSLVVGLDILRIPIPLERALAEERRRRVEAERMCAELQNELSRVLSIPQTLSTAEVKERLYSSWEAHALHGGEPVESREKDGSL